jgi:hypothetical protein
MNLGADYGSLTNRVNQKALLILGAKKPNEIRGWELGFLNHPATG